MHRTDCSIERAPQAHFVIVIACAALAACCDCTDAVVEGHNVRGAPGFTSATYTELLLRWVNDDGETCLRWTPVSLETFRKYNVGDSIHFDHDPAP